MSISIIKNSEKLWRVSADGLVNFYEKSLLESSACQEMAGLVMDDLRRRSEKGDYIAFNTIEACEDFKQTTEELRQELCRESTEILIEYYDLVASSLYPKNKRKIGVAMSLLRARAEGDDAEAFAFLLTL